MFLTTIFIKLDTYHILKLLSSEQVTTFKRKLVSVTKQKLQIMNFFSSVTEGWISYLASGIPPPTWKKRMITVQLDSCWRVYRAKSDEWWEILQYFLVILIIKWLLAWEFYNFWLFPIKNGCILRVLWDCHLYIGTTKICNICQLLWDWWKLTGSVNLWK